MKKIFVLLVISLTLLSQSSFLKAEEMRKKKPSVKKLREEMPYYPDTGFYIDNGYGFGINLLSEDRKIIRDSLWIDGRIGYQFRRHIGVHLDTGYFVTSLKGLGATVNSGYFRIGPGVKVNMPIGDTHFAGFVGMMVGYGSLFAAEPISGVSTHKLGFALGMDGGITGKVNPWLGFSPYIGFHSFFGSENGNNVRSHWLVTGLMLNLFF